MASDARVLAGAGHRKDLGPVPDFSETESAGSCAWGSGRDGYEAGQDSPEE
jgi:hypothetical protein